MRAWLLAAVAALLVACTAAPGASPSAIPSPSANPSPSAGPSSSPSAPPSPSAGPTATLDPSANVAVVRIDRTGGMLPQWITLEWYPDVALYADGRLIMAGPVDAIYPSAALPNLQITQLTPAGVAQVLAWAAQAGLIGPDRELGEPMLDSGTSNFTVIRDGVRHETRVWDMSADLPAVRAVREFRDVLTGIRAWIGNEVAPQDRPYAFDRLRIISVARQPGDMPDQAGVNLRDWPLPDLPLGALGTSIDGQGDGYRCAMIEGDDLAVLLPDLRTANELTLWRSGPDEKTFFLVLHPLLPDEQACPGI